MVRRGHIDLYARATCAWKDGFESSDIVTFSKKEIKFKPITVSKASAPSPIASPISIFEALAPMPPAMPPLPKSAVEVSLPLTAVWGNPRKMMLAQRSRRAAIEDIIDEHCAPSEPLLSRAHLNTKSKHLETSADRNDKTKKAMERGLLTKHWTKRRAAKAAAQAAHEARLAEMVATEASETSDGEVKIAVPRGNERKPPRETAVKRERVRRQARREARDLKCLGADETLEGALEWTALHEASTLFAKKASPEKKPLKPPPTPPAPKLAEAMADAVLDEVLPSRARLAVKSKDPLEAKAAQHAKAVKRGLEKKHWLKVKRSKAAARREHADKLLDLQMEGLMTEHAAPQDAGTPASTRKPRDPYAPKREMSRRNARREARDRKCYMFDDPIEVLALTPDAPPKHKPSGPDPRKLLTKQIIKLLALESRGAALTEVFGEGVILSLDAARDLFSMMIISRQLAARDTASLETERALQDTIAALSGKGAKRKLKALGKKPYKVPKGRGTTAYLRQPFMTKAQGKRAC